MKIVSSLDRAGDLVVLEVMDRTMLTVGRSCLVSTVSQFKNVFSSDTREIPDISRGSVPTLRASVMPYASIIRSAAFSDNKELACSFTRLMQLAYFYKIPM